MRRQEGGRSRVAPRILLVHAALLGLAGLRPTAAEVPVARGTAPALHSDPLAVVVALAVQRPDSLAGLEAIVGPLHRDRTRWEEATGPLDRRLPSPAVRQAHVELSIDPFHFDPRKVEDPRLGSYSLEISAGPGRRVEQAARGALRAAYRPASELVDEGRPVLRFGDFYLRQSGHPDSFTLAWHGREPDFAIPGRSEAETAWLARSLAGLAQAGFSRAAIEARLGRLSYDPRIGTDVVAGETWRLRFKPAGQAKPQEVHLEFVRPLPADAILRAFGVERPAVLSIGSHLLGRVVVDLARPGPFPYLRPARGYQVQMNAAREGLREIPAVGRFQPLWRGDPILLQSLRAWIEPPAQP